MRSAPPPPDKTKTLETINVELRDLLERESVARIEARCVLVTLAKAIAANDRPLVIELMRSLEELLR